jgi:hypothetical protein
LNVILNELLEGHAISTHSLPIRECWLALFNQIDEMLKFGVNSTKRNLLLFNRTAIKDFNEILVVYIKRKLSNLIPVHVIGAFFFFSVLL